MPPRPNQLARVISREAITAPCSCPSRHSLSNKPFTCSPTHPSIAWPFPSLLTNPPRRHLSSSPLLLKKGGKKDSKRTVSAAAETVQDATNPFDFSDLEAGIQEALERLKGDLGRLRPGGRFNPETLEVLRVVLGKGGGKATEAVRLGDLAQVLPKGGRTVVVLVGEEEHVKPISSTILSSPHSLNPVPSPTNPLELHVAIPPPTKESRMQALATASKAGEAAAHAVRQARGAQRKKLRAMGLARLVGPDDLRKAGEKMEKVVEKGSAEVKKVVEGARKVLEQG